MVLFIFAKTSIFFKNFPLISLSIDNSPGRANAGHPIPGVFCAGEMLNWEAPTGGYLLTACFASGYAAGRGVLRWLGVP